MRPDDRVGFGSLEELLAAAVDAPLLVTWEVRPAIGPGWIGGGRTLQLRLGDAAVDEACPAWAALTALVVAALEIPEETDTTCVDGEGELRVEADAIVLDWEVYEAIPYMYGVARHGVTRLVGR
jgi:hypothetical protein